MDLYLNRFIHSDKSEIGLLYIDGKFQNFTIERPWLDNQRSVSCIPEGKYMLGLREDPTPLTMQYREIYDFFQWHLWIKDVKDRSGIYMHHGNYPKDILGCVAVAATYDINTPDFIGNSRKTYSKLYQKLKPQIEKFGDIPLTIDSKIV